MNRKLQEYRKRTRRTQAMQLTNRINAAVTAENIEAYKNTIDTLALCADILGVTLWSGYGEKAAIRLENKLDRAAK